MENIALLPAGMEPWTALLLIGASALTSFITAAFGIGGGVALLAILAVLLPPAALIPVHGVVQLGSNGGRALLMLERIERAALLPFTLGTLLGVAAGGALFVQLPAWLIQFAVAGFIVWSVFGTLPPLDKRHLFAAGAFSSFLTMFFGATGTFVSALVKSMRLEPLSHVATHSALMTIQHGLKVFAFGLLGFAFGPYLAIIAAMIAGGLAGTVLGRRLLSRLGARYFKPVLNAILLALAARLAWSGIVALGAAGG